MHLFFLFILSLFATHAIAAEPFSFSNAYINGFAGINIVNPTELEKDRLNYNAGYLIGGAVGYNCSPFLRVEAETTYRSNTCSHLTPKAHKFKHLKLNTTGNIKKVTVMMNSILQLSLLEDSFTPYCGVGIGQGWGNERFLPDSIVTHKGNTIVYPEEQTIVSGVVYQGIVGMTAFMNQKMHSTVEYRYLYGASMQVNHTLGVNLKRFF